MNDAIREIRDQIRIHSRSKPLRSIRYPAAVRAAAVALARARRREGCSFSKTAGELGLRAPTLYLWLRRKPARLLRPVAVIEATPAPAAARSLPGPVLVTPHGYRIEGLDGAGLAALLRAL